MVEVSPQTIQQLWRETRDSSWESLRRGLDVILERQIISQNIYERMYWAIGKLERLRIDFPVSASELESRMSYYM